MQHAWQPTDTAGHCLECANCGKETSIYQTDYSKVLTEECPKEMMEEELDIWHDIDIYIKTTDLKDGEVRLDIEIDPKTDEAKKILKEKRDFIVSELAKGLPKGAKILPKDKVD